MYAISSDGLVEFPTLNTAQHIFCLNAQENFDSHIQKILATADI
jgi:hypothetical protein